MRAAESIDVDEARELSLRAARLTRRRTCACPDPLDLREERSGLECGRCGSPIHPLRFATEVPAWPTSIP